MMVGLLVSVLAFSMFMAIIVTIELRSHRKQREVRKEVVPAAKVADDLYVKKYGRHSTEIEKAFPELHTVNQG